MSPPSSGWKGKPGKKPAWNSKQGCWFLAPLTPQAWRWSRHVPPKRRQTFNGLHDFFSPQRIELFITVFLFAFPVLQSTYYNSCICPSVCTYGATQELLNEASLNLILRGFIKIWWHGLILVTSDKNNRCVMRIRLCTYVEHRSTSV
jgi:hypothetical protein